MPHGRGERRRAPRGRCARAGAAQVTTIGDFGIEPGRLRLPLDLLILGEGRDPYVTGSQTRPIEVFPGGGLR